MTNTRAGKENNIFAVRNMTILGVLTALLAILALTPLGYLKTGGLSITFNMIPVAIAAIVLGWKGGAILGGVFGLTSIIHAYQGASLTTILLDISVPKTIVLSFAPRILMGICVGLVFSIMAKHIKSKAVCFSVCGLLSAALNTIFYMSSLVGLFYSSDYIQDKWESIAAGKNAIVFIAVFVGTNAIVEAISATIITSAIMMALYKAKLVKLK